MDAYTVEFHQRVHAGYLDMVRAEPNCWAVVDSGQKWELVQGKLRKVVEAKLK